MSVASSAAKVRCKACGFIMAEGVYDECPACGVPSKMFEPFDDKVPEERRKFLDLHIHPVIVHAPQALGFLLAILAVVYAILSQTSSVQALSAILLPAIQVMSVILPFTTLGGLISGMVDGRTRYKRIDTILLKRKIIVGSLFVLLSIALAVIALQPGYAGSLLLQLLYIVLGLGAFACSAFLGSWGAALTLAIMPGPYPKKKVIAKPAE